MDSQCLLEIVNDEKTLSHSGCKSDSFVTSKKSSSYKSVRGLGKMPFSILGTKSSQKFGTIDKMEALMPDFDNSPRKPSNSASVGSSTILVDAGEA